MMDSILINSPFGRKLVSLMLTKAVKSKLGKETDVRLSELRVTLDGEKVKLHVNGDVEMNREMLYDLIKGKEEF